jgi:hypothetical protein
VAGVASNGKTVVPAAAAHSDGSGYVANGVVIFEEEPGDSPATQAATPAAGQLQQRVAAVCGNKARNIAVVNLPGNKLAVNLTVENKTVEAALRNKILQLPEMKQPNVILLITITAD